MKRWKLTTLFVLAVLAAAGLVWSGAVSERPFGIATPYWYGYSAGAKSTYYLAHPTLSANDTAAGIAAVQTLTNKTLTSPTIGTGITGTGVVSATNIADAVREHDISLGDFWTNGAAPLTTTSKPPMAIKDALPAIVWASPAATPILAGPFRVSSDYVSGLGFRLLTSRSAASAQTVGWAVYVNTDDAAFAAASLPQTAVAQTVANGSASNEVIALSPNATAVAAIAAGKWVTLAIWRSNVGAGDLEVKGAQRYYTATQ